MMTAQKRRSSAGSAARAFRSSGSRQINAPGSQASARIFRTSRTTPIELALVTPGEDGGRDRVDVGAREELGERERAHSAGDAIGDRTRRARNRRQRRLAWNRNRIVHERADAAR